VHGQLAALDPLLLDGLADQRLGEVSVLALLDGPNRVGEYGVIKSRDSAGSVIEARCCRRSDASHLGARLLLR
jgi:hypothetical protein